MWKFLLQGAAKIAPWAGAFWVADRTIDKGIQAAEDNAGKVGETIKQTFIDTKDALVNDGKSAFNSVTGVAFDALGVVTGGKLAEEFLSEEKRKGYTSFSVLKKEDGTLDLTKDGNVQLQGMKDGRAKVFAIDLNEAGYKEKENGVIMNKVTDLIGNIMPNASEEEKKKWATALLPVGLAVFTEGGRDITKTLITTVGNNLPWIVGSAAVVGGVAAYLLHKKGETAIDTMIANGTYKGGKDMLSTIEAGMAVAGTSKLELNQKLYEAYTDPFGLTDVDEKTGRRTKELSDVLVSKKDWTEAVREQSRALEEMGFSSGEIKSHEQLMWIRYDEVNAQIAAKATGAIMTGVVHQTAPNIDIHGGDPAFLLANGKHLKAADDLARNSDLIEHKKVDRGNITIHTAK